MKKLFLLVTLGVFLCAGSAIATPVTPTDWDGVTGLTLLMGPTTANFLDGSDNDIGDIKNEVWVPCSAGNLYYYVHEVTPGVDNVSEIATGFPVIGFTGTAGYSFTQAIAAGGGFSIELDPDNSLDWDWSINSSGYWDSGESITLFFVSTVEPGMGTYNLQNMSQGTAESYAPVPEPATMLLLGSGLFGLAVLGRKKFFKK